MSYITDLENLESARRELRKLEDDLISGRLHGNSADVDSAYGAIKLLTECADFLENDASAKKHFSRQLKEYELLVEKLIKVSRRTSNNLFRTIINDVHEFHKKLIANASNKDREEALKQELDTLRDRQIYYETLISEMEANAERVNDVAADLSGVIEGKTTREWTEEYYPYVNSDEESLKKVEDFKQRFIKVKRHGLLMRVLMNVVLVFYKVYLYIVKDIIFYNGKSYKNIVRKWRFWRSFWITLITALALFYLIYFWGYDFESKDIIVFFLEKSIFIPILGAIALGFSFSARNFKINSHLLELYRHRYVVAKTMHNLMILDDLKGDNMLKSEVLQKGSKVLFEFKNTGYMNKSDDEMVTPRDLLEILKAHKGYDRTI